jgi:hypothetical protein
MKKRMINVCFALTVLLQANFAFADWWDCTVDIREQNCFYLFCSAIDTVLEVQAENRSMAVSRALVNHRIVTKPSGETIFVCGQGADRRSDNGDPCEYMIHSASCVRQ